MDNTLGVKGNKYIFKKHEVEDIIVFIGKRKYTYSNLIMVGISKESLNKHLIDYSFSKSIMFSLSSLSGTVKDKANLINYIYRDISGKLGGSGINITTESISKLLSFDDKQMDYVYGLILNEYKDSYR